MRIRSVDCLLLTGPYGDPPGARRSYGVVRVHADEGLIGLGVSLDSSFQQRYPFSDTTCLIA
ncbi:MAG TPA: hypothetical protein VF184_05420 [Phycisphaeraceae bacterium]